MLIFFQDFVKIAKIMWGRQVQGNFDPLYKLVLKAGQRIENPLVSFCQNYARKMGKIELKKRDNGLEFHCP